MSNDNLEVLLDGLGLSEEQVDSIMQAIGQQGKKNMAVSMQDELALLKAQLLSEPDWRKRAALAARIISVGLEIK